MSGLTILLLVVLRVAIGWHFFNEGRDHYFDKKWSSQGFLKIATGPFAAQAKATLPQHHHWDTHIGTAFSDEQYKIANQWYNDLPIAGTSEIPRKAAAERLKKIVEEQKAKSPDDPVDAFLLDEHPLYVNPIYGAWAKQVRDDWRAVVAEADRHYSYSEAQKKQAHQELLRHLDLLEGKLDSMEKDLFEYRAELRRLEKMQADPTTKAVPYEIDRPSRQEKRTGRQAGSLDQRSDGGGNLAA